jgi:phage gpG-like protein
MATIQRLGINIHDWTSELKKTGEYLTSFISTEVFETEGQIIGERWVPLNPSYQAWKQTKYPGRGTLEREGTMRKSFKAASSRNFLRIWNPTPYFAKHQAGLERMPRRVMMKIDRDRTKEIVAIINRGLLERIRRAGGL